MVDATAIAGGLTSLQSCLQIAKSLIDIRDTAIIKAKVAELLGEIASAQEGALRSQEREFALSRQIHELEQRIADMETWNAEKERYKLTDFGGGTFAYLLKPEMSNDEPSHRLCPNCFQKREKSILQFFSRTMTQQDRYGCHSCKTEFCFGIEHEPPPLRSHDPYAI